MEALDMELVLESPELADQLTAELLDDEDQVPGEWARKTVPGNFLREGGQVTFTVELPTVVCEIHALVLRDGESILVRRDFGPTTLGWSPGAPANPDKGWPAHPPGGDSMIVTWLGLTT